MNYFNSLKFVLILSYCYNYTLLIIEEIKKNSSSSIPHEEAALAGLSVDARKTLFKEKESFEVSGVVCVALAVISALAAFAAMSLALVVPVILGVIAAVALGTGVPMLAHAKNLLKKLFADFQLKHGIPLDPTFDLEAVNAYHPPTTGDSK